MSRLLNLYPAGWQERYRAEMHELLVARPPTLVERLDLVGGAVDAWIHPQVRRSTGDDTNDGRELRAATAGAILGGILFVVSGLAITSSRAITAEGYQDNGIAVPILILGMLLTGIAARVIATERRSRNITATMVGGAVLMMLGWPILIVGFFTYVGATIALGAVLLARGHLAGLALIAIGVILPSFNTETDWALAAVPVGVLWIAFATAIRRSGDALPTPIPARGAGGAGG